jgi:hypothetical protein
MPEPNRVVFRKQVSDGNYGSETAEIHLDVEFAEGEVLEEAVAAALANARRLVHDELRHSPSWSVQRALEYPKPEVDHWKQAEEAAELELAAGKRDNARGADPEDIEDLPY